MLNFTAFFIYCVKTIKIILFKSAAAYVAAHEFIFEANGVSSSVGVFNCVLQVVFFCHYAEHSAGASFEFVVFNFGSAVENLNVCKIGVLQLAVGI